MSVLCELTAVTNWRTAVDPVRITPGRVVSLSGTLDGETALLGQNFFNVVSDGLKAELQQSSTHPKGWSAPFRASVVVFASSSDFMADGINQKCETFWTVPAAKAAFLHDF